MTHPKHASDAKASAWPYGLVVLLFAAPLTVAVVFAFTGMKMDDEAQRVLQHEVAKKERVQPQEIQITWMDHRVQRAGLNVILTYSVSSSPDQRAAFRIARPLFGGWYSNGEPYWDHWMKASLRKAKR